MAQPELSNKDISNNVLGPTVLSSSLPKFYLDSLCVYLSNPTVASFIGGGMAGAVSRTVVSPLERMKIIFQVQGPGSYSYNGVYNALIKMWKEEGWRGFMRGNGTNCIRIIPYSAVQFCSYGIMKDLVIKWRLNSSDNINDSKLFTPVDRMMVGAFAGIISVVSTYPLDVIRTRMSIQTASIIAKHGKLNQKVSGIFETGKNIYINEGGFISLYRGMIPTIMGVAPYVGLNFTIYEGLRQFVVTHQNGVEPNSFAKLSCGALSGIIAQTFTYPFDVLRRRFQINNMSKIGFKYKSVWSAIYLIVKNEGFYGLYKGLSANILKAAPSMAANWLTYELVRDYLMGLH